MLRAARNDADGSVAVTLHSGMDTATMAAEIVVEAVRNYQGYNRLASGESAGQTLGEDTLHSDASCTSPRVRARCWPAWAWAATRAPACAAA